MNTPPLLISSTQNPRIKAALRLRESKHRRRTGLFLIEGTREVTRAAQAGVEIAEAFLCPALCEAPERQAAAVLTAGIARQVFHVTLEVYARLAFGDRAEGVLAIGAWPDNTLDDLELPRNPLVAVLEGGEKPGNFGAILRSADGAGVSAVIRADGSHDLYNPNAIRASLGTIFTVPLRQAATRNVQTWLREKNFAIYCTRVGGGLAYDEVDFTRPSAIVLGSESHGLSDLWRGDEMIAIELPMHGSVDSLNVSATAAVLFYEALRQRGVASA